VALAELLPGKTSMNSARGAPAALDMFVSICRERRAACEAAD